MHDAFCRLDEPVGTLGPVPTRFFFVELWGPYNWPKIFGYLVIQAVTFSGWLSDPFKGLSDLQLGDEKVTAWITW